MSVSTLLSLLGITKQSLGRVMDDLTARKLVEVRPGLRDRRLRLLFLTTEGKRLETSLFETIRERMASAYGQAGQGSVTGFWHVLEGLLDPEARRAIAAVQIPK